MRNLLWAKYALHTAARQEVSGEVPIHFPTTLADERPLAGPSAGLTPWTLGQLTEES